MSYQSLLTDKCNVYHLKFTEPVIKYNVETPATPYYSSDPDISNVPCYFSATGGKPTLFQEEPGNVIYETFLIHFLPSVDIRVNDKVIFNGLEYKLGTPRKIRNHHLEVIATRRGNI